MLDQGIAFQHLLDLIVSKTSCLQLAA